MAESTINGINARINKEIGYTGDPHDGYAEHSDRVRRLLGMKNHPNQFVAGLGLSGGILGMAAIPNASTPTRLLAGAAAAGLSGLAAYAYRKKALRELDDAMHTKSRFTYLLEQGHVPDREVNSAQQEELVNGYSK